MKTAIVLIHGIGEQRPTETLREFVDAILPGPEHKKDDPKFYSKPDSISEITDVRLLSDSRKDSKYDFYEFYWAHRVKEIGWKRVLFWLVYILIHPRRLTSRLRRASWALFLLFITVSLLIWWSPVAEWLFDLLGQQQHSTWPGKLLVNILVFVLAAIASDYLVKYIGDAEQYLVPLPENIKVRQEIRAAGLKLLRRLHKPENKYERIFIVGHSLGSVIGYDLIKHLWIEFNNQQRLFPHFPEQELKKRDASKCLQSREDQKKLWEIQKEAVQDREDMNAWLISDFITLGSPLAHAQFLMAKDQDDLKTRQADRELPTCPPVTNEKGREVLCAFYEYKGFLVPHHAAPFVCTQWTNIYFPVT